MKIKVIATLAAIAVASPALASGGGGGGGGGGFSGGGFSGGSPRVQISPEQRSFQRGQKIFKKSLSCSKCAFPRGITSTKQAQDAVTRVKNGQIKLKKSHKKDLLYYMSQRYRVKT